MLPDPAVLTYYGRPEAASPATGSYKSHEAEEREIVNHALDLPATAAAAATATQVAAQQPATAASQRPGSD